MKRWSGIIAFQGVVTLDGGLLFAQDAFIQSRKSGSLYLPPEIKGHDVRTIVVGSVDRIEFTEDGAIWAHGRVEAEFLPAVRDLRPQFEVVAMRRRTKKEAKRGEPSVIVRAGLWGALVGEPEWWHGCTLRLHDD